jgi:cytochrome c-type biogenesis protein CcmH
MVWVVFAFLTAIAVFSVLWPLTRRPRASVRKAADKTFYQTAVTGIDRDCERGLMSEADADAAKAEAARRLIAASGEATNQSVSRTRLRVAALAAIVLVPALSLGLYARIGNPDYPDQPLEARLKAAPGEMDVNAALSKIEKHLADNPDDARGWEIVAPVYLKMGRARDAAEALRNVIRLDGPTAERATAFGQALTFAANGVVTPQARAAFEAALSEEPDNAQARFFVALADEQAGDMPRALDAYTKLLNDGPDAPWAPVVRERIAKLGAGDAAKPAGQPAAGLDAMPAEQREMVRGMVAGLAARLASDGNDVEGWLRLVRSYIVLREPDKAHQALADARRSLASNAQAIEQLNALARELGLGG